MPAFGSILMPTRKVLTSNDPAWVISGHNFVVGGAFGLEIRTCPQGSALWLIVFVNCICTFSSSSKCISGHGRVVGGALCLEIRMGPVAHCICNWYLYLYLKLVFLLLTLYCGYRSEGCFRLGNQGGPCS